MSRNDLTRALAADSDPISPVAESTQSNSAPVLKLIPSATSAKRPKRPVNGFMAFRCMWSSKVLLDVLLWLTHAARYFKIFPSMTQKDISALLTMLWAKDPWKHRWGLIAKVYSFVRDELSSEKMKLTQFLDVACPIMVLPCANEYLAMLGWTMFPDAEGQLTGSQDLSAAATALGHLSTTNFVPPNTELELLTRCVANGFAGNHGSGLVAKIACKDNMLMAVDPEGLLRPSLNQKKALQRRIALFQNIRDSPAAVAANFLGVARASIIADVVTVDDFDQPVELIVPHNDASAFSAKTTELEHSYAMNEIVDNTLAYRYAYHMPASTWHSNTSFDFDASMEIPEFQEASHARLDNPVFLTEIIQASEYSEYIQLVLL